MRCLFQIIQHNNILCNSFASKITHGSEHIVTHITIFPHEVRTTSVVFLFAHVIIVRCIIVQFYTVAIAVDFHSSTGTFCESVRPGMRNDIYHRILFCRYIIGSIHIISIRWLLPWRNKSFVIEWSYFVNGTKSLVGLTTTRIIVRTEYPLKLSANTIFSLFGKFNFGFQQLTGTIFAPFSIHIKSSRLGMKTKAAPCSVFTVQQLIFL